MATKPKQLTQAAQKAITDCATVGFTIWGPTGLSGFTWALDDNRGYHAVWSGTRGGARQSRHACGLMRERLMTQNNKIVSRAAIYVPGFTGDVNDEKDREILRRRLILHSPMWQCDCDGPLVVHPPISTVAVAAIHLEVGQ